MCVCGESLSVGCWGVAMFQLPLSTAILIDLDRSALDKVYAFWLRMIRMSQIAIECKMVTLHNSFVCTLYAAEFVFNTVVGENKVLVFVYVLRISNWLRGLVGFCWLVSVRVCLCMWCIQLSCLL